MSFEPCMCGDTACPSCGRAQGTYPEVDVARLTAIVKREFERRTGFQVREVRFTEDEEIVVATATLNFVMEIGSDDDEFDFRETTGLNAQVRFPFPPDWIEATDGG